MMDPFLERTGLENDGENAAENLSSGVVVMKSAKDGA
jgi:hypothetical protein